MEVFDCCSDNPGHTVKDVMEETLKRTMVTSTGYKELVFGDGRYAGLVAQAKRNLGEHLKLVCDTEFRCIVHRWWLASL